MLHATLKVFFAVAAAALAEGIAAIVMATTSKAEPTRPLRVARIGPLHANGAILIEASRAPLKTEGAYEHLTNLPGFYPAVYPTDAVSAGLHLSAQTLHAHADTCDEAGTLDAHFVSPAMQSACRAFRRDISE